MHKKISNCEYIYINYDIFLESLHQGARLNHFSHIDKYYSW
jgi:hypothetical protein